MGIGEDLADVIQDPEMLRLAIRRAGNRELALDAMQEAARAIAERKSPEPIENLRGFFYVTLIHEIDHQLGRPAPILVEDASTLADPGQHGSPWAADPPAASVESDAQVRIIGEAVLARLGREHARGNLTALVPARSTDPRSYRMAIGSAAKTIFGLLLEGHVTTADWNVILRAAYPQWFDKPGLAGANIDQRLSRARRDVQSLLRSVLSRDELAS